MYSKKNHFPNYNSQKNVKEIIGKKCLSFVISWDEEKSI
jgi:hypothetical protein